MKFYALAALSCLLTMSQSAIAQVIENFALEAVVEDPKAKNDLKFELKEHQGKIVVLHFLLKTECPYCLKYTQQYAQLAATTPDVIHLFIKPDSEEEIIEWSGNLEPIEGVKQPTIYRDPNAKLAKRFKVPFGYQFHGQTVHYPALVVLDGTGKELFRYVGKKNGDRMAKDEFVKRLDELKTK
jgi:thioredoxin-dependent peroxiredoxin